MNIRKIEESYLFEQFSGEKVKYYCTEGAIYRNDHQMNKRIKLVKQFEIYLFNIAGDSLHFDYPIMGSISNDDSLEVALVNYSIIFDLKNENYEVQNSIMLRNTSSFNVAEDNDYEE